MFHQKQIGSYCRCHALNNLIGKELIKLKEFDKYCDEFDSKNNFKVGSSKNNHLFYNNGGTDNIFGYILKRKGIKVKMHHYDFYKVKNIDCKENNGFGYIIYNRGHTYCVRNLNGERWLIDSMKRNTQKIHTLNSLKKKGIGVIYVEKL